MAAPLPSDPSKPYRVISHDGWGNTCVGAFASLEQARELFASLCNDRWFLTDGTVRGLSIEQEGVTLERFAFQRG